MEITTIGIDLAKNVFQVHGVDRRGKGLPRKQLRRNQMAPLFVNLPACLIGMEACASAHHWARKLHALGHTVKLMAPQFVKPYVESNKNDAADAEAIRRSARRSHGGTTDDALRSDQEYRAAVGAVAAPGSPGFREGAAPPKPTGSAGYWVSTDWSCPRASPTSRNACQSSSRTPVTNCLGRSGF